MRAMMLMLAMLTTGCAASLSEPAICAGVKQPAIDHQGGLIEDGGAKSKRTGVVLLEKLRAGCEW